jgi:hypothetical protein
MRPGPSPFEAWPSAKHLRVTETGKHYYAFRTSFITSAASLKAWLAAGTPQ